MSLMILPIGLTIVLFIWITKRSPGGRYPLPPGPPSDPIIGHLRLIPPDHQENVFYEWSKKFGDVIYLRIPGRTMIVLNSVQAAKELLEKRGANYSDRPDFPIFELMGWTPTVTFLKYGKQFLKHRRLLNSYLSHSKCLSHQSLQTDESRLLLKRVLKNPHDFNKHFTRYAASITLGVAYGHEISSDDNSYLNIAEDVRDAQSNSGPPGSTPVDLFPFLRFFPSWFPGAYFAGHARRNRAAVRKLHDYPFANVQDQMSKGTAKPSFLLHHLQMLDRQAVSTGDDIEDIKGAAAAIYGAGSDTTASGLLVFLLAMVLYPQYQKMAQKELDTIVGTDRLPTFEDRGSLPYVECVMQECLRWNSVVPTGVPHVSLEDDIYNGMWIPKGSLIIANIRGMSIDERIYSEALQFNPARYLPKPIGAEEPYPSAHFGFGRRICPGRYLADGSLWIAMASILATCTISKAREQDGSEVTPGVEMTSGISSHPKPYLCSIHPRDEQRCVQLGLLEDS